MKQKISNYLFAIKIYIFIKWLLKFSIKPIKIFISYLEKFKLFRIFKFYFLNSNNFHIIEINQIKFIINASDEVNSKKIYVNRKFPQFSEFCFAVEILKRNEIQIDSILDIGAHYGNIIVPAMSKYNLKQGFAIEPVKDNYDILNYNLSLNNLNEKVLTFNVFASDKSGYQHISTYTNNSAAALVEDNLGKKNRKKYLSLNALKFYKSSVVIETPLSDILPKLESSNLLVWLYAQGSELKIINGSKDLFKSTPPLVMAFSPLLLKNNITLEQYSLFETLNGLKYTRFYNISKKDNKSKNINSNNLGLLENELFKTSKTNLLLFV